MLRFTAIATALAALAAAAPAAADSIVFSKDGNVWVAAPDGSGQHAVTSDGGYSDPTQADDGTILAKRGTHLVRLDRSGNALAPAMPTVITNKPANVNAVGPFDPQISPDGTKVAYWVGVYSSWHDYGNGVTWTRPGSAVVWQDARSGAQLGTTQFYEEPSWLANGSGALLFEETNALTAQVVAAKVGQSHNDVTQWFGDGQTKPADEEFSRPISGGQLTRDGSKLAMLRAGTNLGNGGLSHGNGNTIRIYSASGFGQVPQMWACGIVDAVGGEFDDPTWSPHGDALAWAEGDGIWTTPVAGDCGTGLQPRKIVEGGRDPHFGPADPGAAPAPPAPAAPAQPAAPRVASAPAALRMAAPRTVTRSALRRRGITVRITCPATCTASATLSADGKPIARATRRGSRTVSLPLKPKRAPRTRRLTRVVRASGQTLTQAVRVRGA